MEQLSRNCQINAFNGITDILKTDPKCIVKMFCGTGKSRVIREVVLNQKKDLSIIVFPSLALIRQFTNDYLQTIQSQESHKILNISTEILDDFTSTTDPLEIKKFLKLEKQKIICITYQSLKTLVSNLENTVIGLACFDEAHRTTSYGVKELIYDSDKYEKQVFFTATPINQNGIKMFERDEDEMGRYGDCGKLASEYTYLQGLRDGILSLFELRVDLYTEDTVEHMYESIARAILASGNQRVLTFHAGASESSSSDTSVLRFVDENLFKDVYQDVCEKEFPELLGKIKKITFIPITSGTKNKDEILDKFDKCGDDEIYIVSSCRTIGEGVDTKKANMCVFVDPKSSINAIIQNIGRICRKVGHEEKPASVLIPVCINIDKYRECGEDSEKMDSVLREQLNDSENGDFNAIMNVCAALKQEDPELFKLCLKYPSEFTDSERIHSLNSQGCDLGEEVDYCDIDEMIENGECVEIHTSNVEEPIIYHNMDESDESDNINRFYMISGDDDEEPTYYEIISKDRKKKKKLDAPSTKNRPNLNIHSNDEIKFNWKITDSVMNGKFGSAVIDCCVEKIDNFEKWKMKSEKLIEFLNKNGKSPSHKFKNPDENKLASWNSRQKRIYNPKGPEFSKERMKNPEIWQIWTDIITNEKYSNFLVVIDNIQDWKNKSQEMLEFYDDKGKKPSKCSKNQDEKNLSSWIKNQKQNYNPKGPESSKERMKNPEIWQIWTDIILNEKYSKFLAKSIPTEKWKNDKIKMIEFFDKNGRIPSRHSKNQDEKNLSSWIKNQNAHYNPNGSESSKFIMNNPKIWQIWTDIIVNEKYSKFFVKTIRTDKWKNNKIKMIEFFDKNRKRPSKNSKNQDEKNLTSWIKNQNAQYNPNGPEFSKFIMNNPEIWLIWNATINDHRYKKFFDVSQSSPLPRKRKISTEVQKSQSQSKFPKKDSIMSEEDKSEGSQSESEDIFQSSSLPQKRRFE
jgi:superfamily II DNA or RNA helicase